MLQPDKLTELPDPQLWHPNFPVAHGRGKDTLKLFTFQPLKIAERLQSGETLRADATESLRHSWGATTENPWEDDSLHIITASYDWLAERLGELVGPAPEGVRWPMWAWYMAHPNRGPGKLDLRFSISWCYEPHMLIEFEAPQSQVLLSDYNCWHLPLNGSPIDLSEEESELRDQARKALGFKWHEHWLEKLDHPEAQRMREEDRATWERCIDPNWSAPDWSRQAMGKEPVQAVTWEIRPEQVIRMRPVTTRKSRY